MGNGKADTVKGIDFEQIASAGSLLLAAVLLGLGLNRQMPRHRGRAHGLLHGG